MKIKDFTVKVKKDFKWRFTSIGSEPYENREEALAAARVLMSNLDEIGISYNVSDNDDVWRNVRVEFTCTMKELKKLGLLETAHNPMIFM